MRGIRPPEPRPVAFAIGSSWVRPTRIGRPERWWDEILSAPSAQVASFAILSANDR